MESSAVTPLDVYLALERAYLEDSEQNVYKLSVFLEKQARFVSYLAVSILSSAQEDIIPLPRVAGLGGYLRYLGAVVDLCETSPERSGLARFLRGIVDSIRGPGRDPGPKGYRDYLAHGGIEPSDPAFRAALLAVVGKNSESITRFIAESSSFGTVVLEPLVIEVDGVLALFQDITDGKAVYYSIDRENPIIYFDRERRDLFIDLGRLLSRSSDADEDIRQVDQFKRAIRSDLEGFAESGAVIRVDGRYSPFVVHWVRKLSGGQEERSDSFRVIRNGTRQWFNDDGWVDYEIFLKTIANWEVVLRRSLDRLVDLENAAAKAENDRFNFASQFNLPLSVKTRFDVKSLIGTSFRSEDEGDDIDLESRVDLSAHTATGALQVFFVTGEAGIGKTYNLFQSAIRRARNLVENNSAEPLYLFISCSGVGLKKIDELIDAAVVGTRNLDYKSVLALCRAGIIVLVIDGFDELLGGAGYKDAFKLLSPTLKELGSRGTLLLSARSSYFTNQYQVSLEAAWQTDPMPVHHMVIELSRWRRSDVDRLFDENLAWKPYESKLGESDRDLIGVPFFARAFNDYVLAGSSVENFRGLRTVLIDSYLHREVRKLESGGISGIIGLEQLRAIYVEIAGMLHESSSSQLDIDDFKLACSSALSIEEFSGRHKALGDRLTVLCGMSATMNEGGSPLFGFQHDIFFEVLLADYIAINYLKDGSGHRSLIGFLDRTVLGDATIDSLVHTYPAPISNFIRDATVQVSDRESSLSSNIAALASGVVSSTHSLPGNWFESIDFVELDIASVSAGEIRFRNCKFGRLVIAPNSAELIILDSCEIDVLEVVGESSARLSAVKFSGSVRVVEMTTRADSGQPTGYVDGISYVLEQLASRGVLGLEEKIAQARDSQPSALENFAEDVLVKFSSRRENSYVIEARSRIPGNGASAWMRKPYDPMWADLTNSLEAAGLANVRPINASGPAKSVVTFLAPTWAVADRDSDLLEVRDFWDEVHRHR